MVSCHCAQSSMSVRDPQHASSAVIVIDDDDEEQVGFGLCIGYKVPLHTAYVTQHDPGYTLGPQWKTLRTRAVRLMQCQHMDSTGTSWHLHIERSCWTDMCSS